MFVFLIWMGDIKNQSENSKLILKLRIRIRICWKVSYDIEIKLLFKFIASWNNKPKGKICSIVVSFMWSSINCPIHVFGVLLNELPDLCGFSVLITGFYGFSGFIVFKMTAQITRSTLKNRNLKKVQWAEKSVRLISQ